MNDQSLAVTQQVNEELIISSDESSEDSQNWENVKQPVGINKVVSKLSSIIPSSSPLKESSEIGEQTPYDIMLSVNLRKAISKIWTNFRNNFLGDLSLNT